MIETTVREYFAGKLQIPCLMEKPEDRPARYLVIQKTGSGAENHVFSAVFAIQSYAESLFEAAVLNDKVKALAEQMLELDEIASVELNSDYPFPDLSEKGYRYQAVFDITHY